MRHSVLAIFLLLFITSCSAQQLLPVVLPHDRTNGATCSAADVIDREIADIQSILRDTVVPELNRRYSNQPPCPCGGPGQWTRIAYLNMSDPSQQCPTNWNLITTPV